MVSQSDAFASPFLQIDQQKCVILKVFFTRNSFLSTSATLSPTFCNTLIIHVCNKSIILLPDGFAVESLHLYCIQIYKISGTGPMSIIVGCSLNPSSSQPHIKFLPMNNFWHQLKSLILETPPNCKGQHTFAARMCDNFLMPPFPCTLFCIPETPQ